jgi:hypothetical protein
MILEHSNPHTVYNKQGFEAVWKFKENPTLDYCFWTSDTTLARSPISLKEKSRSLYSAMTTVKTLPR